MFRVSVVVGGGGVGGFRCITEFSLAEAEAVTILQCCRVTVLDIDLIIFI